MFGVDFLGGAQPVTDKLYTHELLADAWGHGMVAVAELNMSTCCYVAGYATKKIGDPDTFVTMSKRPGIGHGWFDKFEDDIRRTGTVVIEGREYPLPKRYFDWSDLSDLKESRKQGAQEAAAKKTPTQHIAARRSQSLNAKQRATQRKGSI